ncbi:MAG: hypothetical protein J6J66_02740 [Clostridia bacterium]|nr:hypothetical protein [Clostridia bacterium]
MRKIEVDFSKTVGPIKAMHAVGQPPFYGMDFSYCRYLAAAHIPYARLHDVGGAYGRSVFVDVPNIFRNFDADENDPASYDFAFTDVLLAELKKHGVDPYFRLGVTIENYASIRAYHIYPPKDFSKWARISEHIVRHYNEGWANGFTYGIEYWEIWNEPEGHPDGTDACMWLGTREEYFELYRVAASHLKKCFGDKIKIGGYASCGFSALKYENAQRALQTGDTRGLTEREAIVLHRQTYYLAFLAMLKEHKPPIDFFSWHSYEPFEFDLVQQAYVEKTLAEAGYGDIEIHLNEWNTHYKTDTRGTAEAAAHSAALMCGMQKTKMTVMNFYDARLGHSVYGGLFNPLTFRPFATYDAFLAFGALYALGTEVAVTGEGSGIYTTAATDGEDKALLIVNTGARKELSLNLEGKYLAYICKNGKRIVPTDADPRSFVLKKNEFILFATKPLTILD